jgi:superfamily I DNA/RNA helicase
MKYKIISIDIIKNLIEFLDGIQFNSAKSNDPESVHHINFCHWAIDELLNGADGFETDAKSDEDMKKSWDDYYEYLIDYELPEDISSIEFQTLIDQFDKFMKGWDKSYDNPADQKEKEENTADKLKNFKSDLETDEDLTPEEKFELYYDEYDKQNSRNNSISFEELISNTGIIYPNK